jgi:hypothetical protein
MLRRPDGVLKKIDKKRPEMARGIVNARNNDDLGNADFRASPGSSFKSRGGFVGICLKNSSNMDYDPFSP